MMTVLFNLRSDSPVSVDKKSTSNKIIKKVFPVGHCGQTGKSIRYRPAEHYDEQRQNETRTGIINAASRSFCFGLGSKGSTQSGIARAI